MSGEWDGTGSTSQQRTKREKLKQLLEKSQS